MEKRHSLIKMSGGACIALFSLLMVSCAQDGFTDETFDRGVRNTTLLSPSVDDITVTASPDGSQTTIAWPTVFGAGGYKCSVFDVTNPEKPVIIDEVADSLVDGCSLVISRAEETNYKFTIQTIGDTKLNNKDAESTTEVAFTTFVPAYAAIPSGTDLYEYFQSNPLPAGNTDELPVDLESGGSYTISDALDFGANRVTLRCTNKENRPTITYGEKGGITTSAPLAIKNIKFECAQSDDAVIALSKTPAEGILGKGDYYIVNGAFNIVNCEFNDVKAQFIYDNDVKYCLSNAIIDNCIVKLSSSASSGVSGNAVIYFKQGFINSLLISNSTFYQTSTDADAKYFVQYNNSGRCDRAGFNRNSISYTNNTFYNVVKSGQWGNYNGFAGRNTSDWLMANNIFVDCGNKQIARRFLHGRGGQATATFSFNTYMFEGEYENTENYDASGTNIEEDPKFANPAGGDFTVGGAAQLEKRTGDPRWLPNN